MNNKPTLKSIYEKQKQLAAQQALEQERLAREQASKQQQQLANQLKEQRYDYQQLKQIANRQINQRGRNLLNQLSNRGLATSGLLQLGDVQNRLATGQTLSELAQENRRVQEAGMQARENISSNLQNALRQALLDRQIGEISADKEYLDREQVKKEQQLQAYLSLMEAAQSGEFSDFQLNQLLKQYENTYGDSEIQEGQESGSLRDAITRAKSELDEHQLKELADWGTIGKTTALVGAVGTPAGPLGTAIGSVVGFLGGLGREYGSRLWGIGNSPVQYNIPNLGKRTYKNIDEAISDISKLYKDRPYSDKIKVVAEKNAFGARTGNIRFEVNGQQYKTYNQAVNAIEMYGMYR
jgi:hypothetical protein